MRGGRVGRSGRGERWDIDQLMGGVDGRVKERELVIHCQRSSGSSDSETARYRIQQPVGIVVQQERSQRAR